MTDIITAKQCLEALQKLQPKIANHFANYKKKGATVMTRELAEKRILRLKELWDEFVTHDECLRNSIDVDFQHDYFTKDIFYDIQDIYDDVQDLYVQFLKTQPAAPIQGQAQPAVPVNAPPTPPQEDLIGMSALLRYFPKTSLPKFSGKTSEWPYFRDMFISMVHKQSAPSVTKLNCLNTHLTGEALDVIKNIPISETNYEVAWETLTLHYKNLRRLVHNHLAEIFLVEPMASESSAEIKRILGQFFSPLEALTSLGRPTKQWADIMVFMLTKRMDQAKPRVVNGKNHW